MCLAHTLNAKHHNYSVCVSVRCDVFFSSPSQCVESNGNNKHNAIISFCVPFSPFGIGDGGGVKSDWLLSYTNWLFQRLVFPRSD